MKDLAPIVLFVYDRPWHTRECLESLSKNELAEPSSLFIYADGPNANATEEQLQKINEVRQVIKQKKWCGTVEIIERQENRGLAKSITAGVTEIINRFGKVIVLEDDLVLSEGFLKYMNAALDIFKEEEKVMHISGYVYPVRQKLPETFFYQQTTCWGWGTWKRAWQKFSNDRPLLAGKVKDIGIDEFNLDNSYGFYELLKSPSDGWAVCWYATVFINHGLALHPGKTLVKNIGNDGTGTHPYITKAYDQKVLAKNIAVTKINVSEDAKAKGIITDYFKSISKTPFYKKVIPYFKYKVKKALPLFSIKKPILWNNFRSINPVSRSFGLDRGSSIDRYYIEDFLKQNNHYIRNNVLEVGELVYTHKYGSSLENTHIVSADSNNKDRTVVTDLTDISNLPDSYYDCFICTQTFNFIYEFRKAIEGAYKLLKPNGVLLATVAGVCQISQYDASRWGDYWRFTPMSVQKTFGDVFGEKNIDVSLYGNCLSAMALLKGLASEELKKEELDYKDEDYPVVITVVAIKK
jgi:hypothetical protein